MQITRDEVKQIYSIYEVELSEKDLEGLTLDAQEFRYEEAVRLCHVWAKQEAHEIFCDGQEARDKEQYEGRGQA
jgi:hypothetical protein